MAVEPGSIVQGTVTRITTFGAFVALPDNLTGMVHISEVDESFVQDISAFLKIGDSVSVKVLGIDDSNRISLSIRKARPESSPPEMPLRRQQSNENFDEMVSHFMKDSEERLLDVRRALRQKRGYSRR